MTKAKISEYDAVAANNTDVNGVNIAEGCPPSGMNNMGREIMAALKRFQTGADGDSVTVGGSLVVSGSSTFTNTTVLSNVTSATLAAGTVSAPTVKASGDTNTGVYFPAADEVAIAAGGSVAGAFNSHQFMGMRNRIINGDMRIAQRGTGAFTTTASFPVDRFRVDEDTDGAFSAQQDSSAPAGFVNSIKLTTTTADASLGATQYYRLLQRIEGTNVSDLGWGTADAKTVTLSFWVRSSLTGTFGGALINEAASRSYPFTYSISAADTWEYKTITIPGDTTGTWLTTTGIGIRVNWGLGVGSTYSGTAGAWAAANYMSATGATSVIGTLNATWYVTGVQLEVGSVATPFERRPYGTELALCQRYYYRIKADAGGQVLGSGMMQTATAGRFFIPFMVPMRTSPSALEQSGTASNYVVFNGGSAQNCDAVPTFNSATLYGAGLQATIASGGTIGYGALIRADSSAAYLAWSAEL